MNKIPSIPSHIEATIMLPSSKSMSNRALLINALSGGGGEVENVSDCDDTFVMKRALTEHTPVVDIMAAGTAMRFLTAYFSVCEGGRHVLTGTERMRQRPISILVDALRSLGADISYEGAEGYPPLRISGRRITGGRLSLSAGVSSQYISALLMTAPVMTHGLELTLEGDIVSLPYIRMTVEMMRAAGAEVVWNAPNLIKVQPRPYAQDQVMRIESDWSAASYWYEMMALTSDTSSCVTLPLLFRESLQGDSIVASLFEKLGVKTTYRTEGETPCVVLTRTPGERPVQGTVWEQCFVECPDLAQTLVVVCALLQQPFRFTGLRSLRIKETDRLAALQNELAKLGIRLGIEGDDCACLTPDCTLRPMWNGQPIHTYNDHRMAMAFAPAAMVCEGLEIADAEVVSKSYPGYWRDLETILHK